METRIGDVAVFNKKNISSKSDWTYINYLDTGNITQNKIDEIVRYPFPTKEVPSRAKRIVSNGTIIYSTVRPNQLHYGFLKNIPENLVVSTGFTTIDVNSNIACPKYIYYFLTQLDITNTLHAIAEQSVSTYPSIKPDDIANLTIELPSLDIQRKIASILSAIDVKIELNNKINENFIQQMKNIFKNSFIDNSEYEQWKSSNFSDLIQDTLGGDWGKDNAIGNYTKKVYCIRGADIPDVKIGNKGKMPFRYILPKNYDSKKLSAGDMVVEISGGSPTQSTGRIVYITQSLLDRYDEGMVCTNFCRTVTPKEGYGMYIYYYWQYLYDAKLFFNFENGTTGIKNFDMSGFTTKYEIKIAPMELINKFNNFCNVLFDKISAIGLENERLTELRDILLPKLMSGEIDVDSIDI